jgi:hypothetical protein
MVFWIFAALAVADVDLPLLKVDVVHSQLQHLEQAKATSIQEPNDQGDGPVDLVQ